MTLDLHYLNDLPQLCKDYLALCASRLDENEFASLAYDFSHSKDGAPAQLFSEIRLRQTGVYENTLQLLTVIKAIPFLEKTYKEKHYPSYCFNGFLEDIKCKINECHKLRGIWGTLCYNWHRGFFLEEKHSMGRLQFEKKQWEWGNDITSFAQNGSPILNVHIPSSGPLTKELVMQSLENAYAFHHYNGKPMVVTVKSWLACPSLSSCFPEGSNLKNFYKLFTNVTEESRFMKDFHLIFGCYYDGNLTNLPQESRLQKNVAEFIKNGNHINMGYSYLVFDGKEIINESEMDR